MKKILLTAVAVATLTTAAWAEESPNVIMTAMPSLTIAPDARSAGMGDAGVATAPDMYSQHFNAAKYAFL